MAGRGPQMVELFHSELELCRVREGETLAVLSCGDTLRDYAEVLLQAARALGARALDVNIPGPRGESPDDRMKKLGQSRLQEHPAAMAQLTSADMVVDLLVASFSREGDEIQRSGARMLMVCEELDTLQRLFPTPEHRARTEAAMRRISRARTFRFVNAAGTDVTYRFGSRYKPLMEYGYTADPGRWDHWPAGLVAHCAEQVEGRVVMNPGDIVYPTKWILSEPIEFEIEAAMVRRLRGGRQADELRRFMDGYGDQRAYAVSHIGWGTHAGAEWSARGIGMDGRSYYGGVLFSLGPNLEFGGDNDTACHMDLPMRGCTAWVDGELIIEAGRILPTDMQAPGR